MFKGCTLKNENNLNINNIGLIKLPDTHTMEHQANRKIRKLPSEMKWYPQLLLNAKYKSVYVLINVCLWKNLSEIVNLWPTEWLKEEREHLIQLLPLGSLEKVTCTQLALYPLTMLYVFNSISLSEVIVYSWLFPILCSKMSAQRVQY